MREMDWEDDLKKLIKTNNIKAVVLDFDGTITNLVVDWNTLKENLSKIFKVNKSSINEMLVDIAKKNETQLLKAYSMIEEFELDGLKKETPHNLSELLNFLIERNIKIAICSNNMSITVKKYLSMNKMNKLGILIVGKDNVKNYKPSVEGVEKILESFHLEPNEAVLVGDSQIDRILSKSSGLFFIQV